MQTLSSHPRIASAILRALVGSVLVSVFLISPARANWFDAAWHFRRPIDVTWDAEHGSDDSLATAEFYTAGHSTADAKDVRVATDGGKLVASHVLMAGPGDRVVVVFSLVKPLRKYYVYFGNPDAPPPPQPVADVRYHCGLLMETKQWTGGAVDNFSQVESSWDRSTPVLGKTMVGRVFVGVNPFGDQEQWISKLTGSLFAPEDGRYTFALSGDDKASLYLDGKPILFAPYGPADTRFHKELDLTRGPHDVTVYHVNTANEGRVSLGWKTPSMGKVEVISREAFGVVVGSVPGPLEELKKVLTADFKTEYRGECFFNEGYSQRYHFVATAGAVSGSAKFAWDFGDGQTASGNEVDHVYLAAGVYPVRVTARVGANSDAQTTQYSVSRDFPHLDAPKQDDLGAQSKDVADYNVDTMPASWLPRAVWLHLKAHQRDLALKAGQRLAGLSRHVDPPIAMRALRDLTKECESNGRAEEAIALYDRVPRDSDIQPWAARQEVAALIWWQPDFDRAVKLLDPYKDRKDDGLHRQLGQALVLSGKADAGAKILRDVPEKGPPGKQAVISGALARTIEAYIDQGDWESGEETWEKWQTQYPTDFLVGYSVLLRTKLMEIKKYPQAAAKVAEAFATALPGSTYAPSLLDRASKLLQQTDPGKAAAIRQTLKQKYPEDPLSQ